MEISVSLIYTFRPQSQGYPGPGLRHSLWTLWTRSRLQPHFKSILQFRLSFNHIEVFLCTGEILISSGPRSTRNASLNQGSGWPSYFKAASKCQTNVAKDILTSIIAISHFIYPAHPRAMQLRSPEEKGSQAALLQVSLPFSDAIQRSGINEFGFEKLRSSCIIVQYDVLTIV